MSDSIDAAQARQRLESDRGRVTGLISSLREEIGDTGETESPQHERAQALAGDD